MCFRGMVIPNVTLNRFEMHQYLVPIGAMGVASNEYVPSVASKTNNFGFNVPGCIMLSVMSHVSVIRH